MSMRRLKISFFTVCLIFVCAPAQARTPLEARIEKILRESGLDAKKTGVVVAKADGGEIMASINGDIPLNPASLTKIATSAAALSILGPNYQFETSFYSEKSPDPSGKITTLFISGGGDPVLVNEELWRIVHDLALAGVKAIDGDIVVDDSLYDGPWYPRKEGDDSRAFTSPTSALSLNFNSIMFLITPGAKTGTRAVVTTNPETSYIKIINKVQTGRRLNIQISSKDTGGIETFTLSGTISKLAQPYSFYRSIQHPALYMASVLKDFLGQYGIAVTGSVRRGAIPADSRTIIREKSKPLDQIIVDMNKFSNNFIAEQLIKHLGAVKKEKPGSTLKGISVVSDFLVKMGMSNFVLENGSGLSGKTRFSAMQIAKILLAGYKNPAIDLISSFSILGVDGTMRSWKSKPHLTGLLRAKTGSLDNVSALAGFVPMRDGRLAVFAIIANGFKRGKYSVHDAKLEIAEAIFED